MTSAEFTEWVAYAEVAGPFDLQRRYDRPAALIAWMLQRVNGGKGEFADFLPRFDTPQDPADGWNDVDRQLLSALKQSGQNRF